MNPTKPQPNVDQIRGNLGFITNMHEQLLQHKAGKQQASQAPQPAQNASAQAPQPKPQETPQNSDLDVKMTEMEGRLSKQIEELGKGMMSSEGKDIDALKKEIEAVLKESDE